MAESRACRMLPVPALFYDPSYAPQGWVMMDVYGNVKILERGDTLTLVGCDAPGILIEPEGVPLEGAPESYQALQKIARHLGMADQEIDDLKLAAEVALTLLLQSDREKSVDEPRERS